MRAPSSGQNEGMRWIWNFYIYSFLGFLLELGYARVIRAKKLDRKCRLFLPLCPVYGLGTTVITLLPEAVTRSPLLLFFASAVLATGVEYLAAVFYEKIWHVSFWDYRSLPGNLQGRVCLPFAVIWGILGLGLIYWLHPRVSALTALIPDELLPPVTLLFAVDFALTGYVLRRSENTAALRWYLE